MLSIRAPVELTSGGETVVLLHGSAGSKGHWDDLCRCLAADPSLPNRILAPDLTGYGEAAPWPGREPYSLTAEAALLEPLTRGTRSHLVGHSFGGAVALRLAQEHPDRCKSLTLIEPVAFHVLREVGPEGRALLVEIETLAAEIARLVRCGNQARAMATFVDYWSGTGTFARLRPALQDELTALATKINLDFHATLAEPTPLAAYGALEMPTLVLAGAWSPTPTRRIAQILARTIPSAGFRMVNGAGHMLPLTKKDEAAALITGHLRAASGTPLARAA